MKNNGQVTPAFRYIDILLICMMILPLFGALAVQALFQPASSADLEITGAKIYFTIPMPLQDLEITESQVNSLAVMLSIFFLCLYLTHGLSTKAVLKRQLAVEWAVEKVKALVADNMGELFRGFAPFVGAILLLSAFSSLSSLIGLYPPTSDLNIVLGWAVLVFILITWYKLKGGVFHYLKSFTEPVALFTPLNIFSEFATPVSMSFRHFGNVLSGSVISALIAMALARVSSALFSWLPGILSQVPFLQVGLPAVLSIYFDVFSGCLQAFIFAMLTMLNIAGAFPQDEWEKRRARRAARQLKRAEQQ